MKMDPRFSSVELLVVIFLYIRCSLRTLVFVIASAIRKKAGKILLDYGVEHNEIVCRYILFFFIVTSSSLSRYPGTVP